MLERLPYDLREYTFELYLDGLRVRMHERDDFVTRQAPSPLSLPRHEEGTEAIDGTRIFNCGLELTIEVGAQLSADLYDEEPSCVLGRSYVGRDDHTSRVDHTMDHIIGNQ